jgi:hypothetical protein
MASECCAAYAARLLTVASGCVGLGELEVATRRARGSLPAGCGPRKRRASRTALEVMLTTVQDSGKSADANQQPACLGCARARAAV